MKKIYRSAVSYWLYIPLCILPLGAFVLALISGEWIAIILMGLVVFGLLLPILLHTRYTITGDTLQIRCGWMVREDIPIVRIREIKKTDSVLSSPALSVKNRIQIAYAKYDDIVISPERRDEFIADLQRINPDIKVEL